MNVGVGAISRGSSSATRDNGNCNGNFGHDGYTVQGLCCQGFAGTWADIDADPCVKCIAARFAARALPPSRDNQRASCAADRCEEPSGDSDAGSQRRRHECEGDMSRSFGECCIAFPNNNSSLKFDRGSLHRHLEAGDGDKPTERELSSDLRRSPIGINRSCNSLVASPFPRFQRRRSVGSSSISCSLLPAVCASDAHTHTGRPDGLRRNLLIPSGLKPILI